LYSRRSGVFPCFRIIVMEIWGAGGLISATLPDGGVAYRVSSGRDMLED
jgi:hypothetical protein